MPHSGRLKKRGNTFQLYIEHKYIFTNKIPKPKKRHLKSQFFMYRNGDNSQFLSPTLVTFHGFEGCSKKFPEEKKTYIVEFRKR